MKEADEIYEAEATLGEMKARRKERNEVGPEELKKLLDKYTILICSHTNSNALTPINTESIITIFRK